jgi:3-hydroxyisobutyrate dehydrogenase-like beta-hydroxyacid dehydrogenase
MGAAVAAQAVAGGAQVYWLPEGRGAATRERAESIGLRPAASLAELADSCGLIISVCPPAAALAVARSVAATSFAGVYLDANAISPDHSQEIADLLSAGGATVADGGIVGSPPRQSGTTRLYLSGPEAAVERVREVFADTALAAMVVPGPVGRASALKLAFASYNKISYALAAQACALAAGHGVLDELLELTAQTLPNTPLGRPDNLVTAGPRAWRWAPEMQEIAQACACVGVSPDLAQAAAALMDRWSAHKDDADVTLAQLTADLRDPS